MVSHSLPSNFVVHKVSLPILYNTKYPFPHCTTQQSNAYVCKGTLRPVSWTDRSVPQWLPWLPISQSSSHQVRCSHQSRCSHQNIATSGSWASNNCCDTLVIQEVTSVSPAVPAIGWHHHHQSAAAPPPFPLCKQHHRCEWDPSIWEPRCAAVSCQCPSSPESDSCWRATMSQREVCGHNYQHQSSCHRKQQKQLKTNLYTII